MEKLTEVGHTSDISCFCFRLCRLLQYIFLAAVRTIYLFGSLHEHLLGYVDLVRPMQLIVASGEA